MLSHLKIPPFKFGLSSSCCFQTRCPHLLFWATDTSSQWKRQATMMTNERKVNEKTQNTVCNNIDNIVVSLFEDWLSLSNTESEQACGSCAEYLDICQSNTFSKSLLLSKLWIYQKPTVIVVTENSVTVNVGDVVFNCQIYYQLHMAEECDLKWKGVLWRLRLGDRLWVGETWHQQAAYFRRVLTTQHKGCAPSAKSTQHIFNCRKV